MFDNKKPLRTNLGRVALLLLFASVVACSAFDSRQQDWESGATALPGDQASMAGARALQLQKHPPGSRHHRGRKPLYVGDKGLRGETAQECGSKQFALRDLAAKSISFSYQDVDAAMGLLSAMGYTVVVNDSSKPGGQAAGATYSCDQMPIVMLNTESDDSKLSVGGPPPIQSGISDSGGMAAVDGSSGAIQRSHAADIDRVVAFYHPKHSELLSRLQRHVRYVVDTPAPQVYIEGWVLEISEEDSRELGIRYSNDIGSNSELQLGSTDGEGDSLSYLSDSRLDADGNPLFVPAQGVLKRLRALVENEKAKILSRPSLLTLSNRQSVIQVVDVVQYPLLETTLQSQTSVTSGLQFGSLRIGITLNLRPRVSADRQWVSLEIDAVVDAEDEENTGQAFGIDPETGERVLLSSKPGFNSRRVQTFARIPDRTPIIVGGLVSTEDSVVKKRIPLLGEIPWIGPLFGFTDKDVTQREIMIVLTPYVLAEEAASVRTNSPKGSSAFDDSDMALFDNRYRLREEDVFDLRSITGDPRFVRHELAAKRSIHADRSLLDDPRIASFVDGRIPGGRALLDRTFFDLARKRGLGLSLDPGQVRVWRKSGEQIVPTSLADVLDALGEGQKAIFERIPGELRDGVYVRMVDRGHAVPEGAVAIRNDASSRRLMDSIVALEMMDINGGLQNLRIRHLRVGQYVALPDLSEEQKLEVTPDTLRVYENTMEYETVVSDELRRAYEVIEAGRAATAGSKPVQGAGE